MQSVYKSLKASKYLLIAARFSQQFLFVCVFFEDAVKDGGKWTGHGCVVKRQPHCVEKRLQRNNGTTGLKSIARESQ